eukprot:TRINITY_DN50076_c0_g1_i1.p1 TRINITY_DN50076_c0_g1~~TRINITY_DN50076_c0_g1_i1.p1  ORF type:complete len:545 (-),score=126.97 TRINITY_DN50076_c0_g1_i1:34-1668(-)
MIGPAPPPANLGLHDSDELLADQSIWPEHVEPWMSSLGADELPALATEPEQSCLLVHGFSPDWNEGSVKRLFTMHCEVEAVRILQDPACGRIAYVWLVDTDLTASMVKLVDGREFSGGFGAEECMIHCRHLHGQCERRRLRNEAETFLAGSASCSQSSISSLSVRELREILLSRREDFADCVEKGDLVNRVKVFLARRRRLVAAAIVAADAGEAPVRRRLARASLEIEKLRMEPRWLSAERDAMTNADAFAVALRRWTHERRQYEHAAMRRADEDSRHIEEVEKRRLTAAEEERQRREADRINECRERADMEIEDSLSSKVVKALRKFRLLQVAEEKRLHEEALRLKKEKEEQRRKQEEERRRKQEEEDLLQMEVAQNKRRLALARRRQQEEDEAERLAKEQEQEKTRQDELRRETLQAKHNKEEQIRKRKAEELEKQQRAEEIKRRKSQEEAERKQKALVEEEAELRRIREEALRKKRLQEQCNDVERIKKEAARQVKLARREARGKGLQTVSAEEAEERLRQDMAKKKQQSSAASVVEIEDE